MLPILTNFGARCAASCPGSPGLSALYNQLQMQALKSLHKGLPVRSDAGAIDELCAMGLVELVDSGTAPEIVQLRYKRNPLEHVREVVFEHTSMCNFTCPACYNSTVARTTERDVELLKRAARDFVMMGVGVFAFIGGEVSKYGTNWLSLATYLRSFGGLRVALVTNGWFCLEEGGFTAAGIEYAGRAHYLDELRNSGVTNVLFSLDGKKEAHDASRGRPTLYDSIIRGIGEVRDAGMKAGVSLLCAPDMDDNFFVEVADVLYGHDLSGNVRASAARLLGDSGNILSSRIDVGNDAARDSGNVTLANSRGDLRCKGFFRPSTLTIKANGEVATCRLSNIGEGYGNIHERPLVEILNGMQDSFVFRLHAQDLISGYAAHVLPSVFGSSFRHQCALRSVVTAVAKEIEKAGGDTENPDVILRSNRLAAGFTGHLGKIPKDEGRGTRDEKS